MTEETKLKNQIKEYLALRGIFNWHLLQGIGSFRGAPDRIMHHRGKIIYLEIKKKKGKLSERQIEFQEQCLIDNVDYLVIRSLEDLINYLK